MDMMIEPSWWKYAIFNDDGLCGISDNAPAEEKAKYNDYIKEKEEYRKAGEFIPR